MAVVNTQEIFPAHPAYEEVGQKLQERQTEMRAELEELEGQEAEKRQQEMQQELQQLQQKLAEEATEEINGDVEDMAKELGFNVVIDQGGIISGEEELGAEDITEEIIAEIEKEYDLS